MKSVPRVEQLEEERQTKEERRGLVRPGDGRECKGVEMESGRKRNKRGEDEYGIVEIQRERERERESVSVCSCVYVCVCERERKGGGERGIGSGMKININSNTRKYQIEGGKS